MRPDARKHNDRKSTEQKLDRFKDILFEYLSKIMSYAYINFKFKFKV